MKTFINKYTGGVMYVDESRVSEYEALGHTPAAEVIAEVEPVEVQPKAIEAQAKATAKRPRKRDPKEW